MPIVGKLGRIVMRLVYSRMFGTRLHAIYGETEMVLSLWPLRVIQGEAPEWVQQQVLAWASTHHAQLLAAAENCRLGLVPAPVN
jgi:hypothetical protein